LTLWQIAAMAVLIATVCAVLRDGGGKFAPVVAAVGGVLLSCVAIRRLSGTVELIRRIGTTPLSPYLTVILRAIGVGYVVKVGGDICRDLGAAETADRLELCGKAELLLLAAPYLAQLITLAVGLAEGTA